MTQPDGQNGNRGNADESWRDKTIGRPPHTSLETYTRQFDSGIRTLGDASEAGWQAMSLAGFGPAQRVHILQAIEEAGGSFGDVETSKLVFPEGELRLSDLRDHNLIDNLAWRGVLFGRTFTPESFEEAVLSEDDSILGIRIVRGIIRSTPTIINKVLRQGRDIVSSRLLAEENRRRVLDAKQRYSPGLPIEPEDGSALDSPPDVRVEAPTVDPRSDTDWEAQTLVPFGRPHEQARMADKYPTLGSLKTVSWAQLSRSLSIDAAFALVRQLDQAGGRLKNGPVSELEIPDVGTIKVCDIEGLNTREIKALGESPLFGMTGRNAYEPERFFHVLSVSARSVNVAVDPDHVLRLATDTLIQRQQEQQEQQEQQDMNYEAATSGQPEIGTTENDAPALDNAIYSEVSPERGTSEVASSNGRSSRSIDDGQQRVDVRIDDAQFRSTRPQTRRPAARRPATRRGALVLAANASDGAPNEQVTSRAAAPSALGGVSAEVERAEPLTSNEPGSRDEIPDNADQAQRVAAPDSLGINLGDQLP